MSTSRFPKPGKTEKMYLLFVASDPSLKEILSVFRDLENDDVVEAKALSLEHIESEKLQSEILSLQNSVLCILFGGASKESSRAYDDMLGNLHLFQFLRRMPRFINLISLFGLTTVVKTLLFVRAAAFYRWRDIPSMQWDYDFVSRLSVWKEMQVSGAFFKLPFLLDDTVCAVRAFVVPGGCFEGDYSFYVQRSGLKLFQFHLHDLKNWTLAGFVRRYGRQFLNEPRPVTYTRFCQKHRVVLDRLQFRLNCFKAMGCDAAANPAIELLSAEYDLLSKYTMPENSHHMLDVEGSKKDVRECLDLWEEVATIARYHYEKYSRTCS